MPLDRYRQKRDFASTPEPTGDERVRARRAARPTDRFFCVQKHLSSHLHYDLRLEHGGVLLSWAVPKGPSLDSRDRRLALQTEDHPFEYGMFEGVIPSGYGAGIVMLWDHGIWRPEVDDVDAALRKGDLKFTLDGYKLKGSWVLVRTRGYGSARERDVKAQQSWLLIKHRDDWSGPIDITTFAPLSVKSEGDFADILAADDPDVWTTSRPAKTGETGEMLAAIIEEAARRRLAAARAGPGTEAGAAARGAGLARRRKHASSRTRRPPTKSRRRKR